MTGLETAVAAHWSEMSTDIGNMPAAQAVGILAARATDLLSVGGGELPFHYRSGFQRLKVTKGTIAGRVLPRLRASVQDPDSHLTPHSSKANFAGMVGPDTDGKLYFEQYYPANEIRSVFSIDPDKPENSVGAQWQDGNWPEALPMGVVVDRVADITMQLASPYIRSDCDAWPAGSSPEGVFLHPALQGPSAYDENIG